MASQYGTGVQRVRPGGIRGRVAALGETLAGLLERPEAILQRRIAEG